MEFSDDEWRMVLAGLFELTITRAEADEQREAIRALLRKLGGDPQATFVRNESG